MHGNMNVMLFILSFKYSDTLVRKQKINSRLSSNYAQKEATSLAQTSYEVPLF